MRELLKGSLALTLTLRSSCPLVRSNNLKPPLQVYRHPSCLIKHRKFRFYESTFHLSSYRNLTTFWVLGWEHSPHWREASKFLLSKHQQVQLLEVRSFPPTHPNLIRMLNHKFSVRPQLSSHTSHLQLTVEPLYLKTVPYGPLFFLEDSSLLHLQPILSLTIPLHPQLTGIPLLTRRCILRLPRYRLRRWKRI